MSEEYKKGYSEGWKSIDHSSIIDNPHSYGSINYIDWDSGFIAGQKDRKLQKEKQLTDEGDLPI